MRGLLETLCKTPERTVIPIGENDLTIIQDPTSFYKTIINKIDQAKNRIIISSLYIGETEMELLQKLSKAKNILNVKILLDYSRSHRSKESELALKPLNNCIYFYKNQSFSQYLNPIEYLNEIMGVMHMKWLVFDDTVIVTGANLSMDYFKNRQDRYYEIQSKTLADYYEHVFDCMKENRLPKFHCDYNLTKTCNTFVIPTLQIPLLHYNEEILLFEQILASIDAKRILKAVMATPYLNFSENMQELLFDRYYGSWKIITSSHETNGFLKGGGFKSKIPNIYDCFQFEAAKRLKESSIIKHEDNNKERLICQYHHNDKVFHAKGVWIDLGSSLITSIGSSNFSSRSSFRDVESQVWIFTSDIEHMKLVRNDLFNIELRSKPINIKKPKRLTFLLSKLLKSYF